MEKLILPAKLDNLDQMISFVVDGVKALGFEEKCASQIQLVCEEALVNVINYAYPEGQGDVDLGYSIDPASKVLTIIISDKGVAFNPLEKQDPDINQAVEERPIGGLGIFMIRKIMDSVTYQREGGCNILTLVKDLGLKQ